MGVRILYLENQKYFQTLERHVKMKTLVVNNISEQETQTQITLRFKEETLRESFCPWEL